MRISIRRLFAFNSSNLTRHSRRRDIATVSMRRSLDGMEVVCDVFLSYSRSDPEATANLRSQLEKAGLSVFKDDQSIREGDLWLTRLQEVLDGCGGFVVLVGRDGVRRWMGAETQTALIRYFGPNNDAKRLPIFPILLGDTAPEKLPAFLRLFQATAWNGSDPLPESLLEQIRAGKIVPSKAAVFEGCPYVGLDAFRIHQARLFFGRQKETLEALACFDTRRGTPRVRWLEINGNSGCGKSSLMNAGLLPLVHQGWLWPRTRIAHWLRIGPMMPGKRPVAMLAESLAHFSRESLHEPQEMDHVRDALEQDDRGLAEWLRGRKRDDTAFLLALDQFEELFTFAEPNERRTFDLLLATALEDDDCPLFVVSTMRADFLDRFDGLPRLVAIRNRLCRPRTLPPIGADNLREVIAGPARLARLDVSHVQEAMVADASNEPGALPLVEYALTWLWEMRQNDLLSGELFNDHGRLAGIFSKSADELLNELDEERRKHALELLFRLIKVDSEGFRHTCQRMDIDEAEIMLGGGGRDLLDRLAGRRNTGYAVGPARLITITDKGRWVNLIHETLIRNKGIDAMGKPQPYWPTLFTYIEKHKERAAWLRRLREDTRFWIDNGKRDSDVWSHERVSEVLAALRQVDIEVKLSVEEQEFLGPIDANAMLAELKCPNTTHRRRALIGERLAILGDPRDGVGIDPDGTPKIKWCKVERGRVAVSIMLSNPEDPHPEYETRDRIVERFWIGRYPITVSQYRSFLKADDGWRQQDIWQPDLYRDPVGDSYQIGRFDNEPAVYVSWFEAMAFCRWLGRRLGLERAVRLPDEWEWQLAGTGEEPNRIFPWGLNWNTSQEPNRANTIESRLGRITSVGMYPDGGSLLGVMDMAGTVYEWCVNKFETPYETASLGDDLAYRARRGGSWSGPGRSASFTYRARLKPLSRTNNIGFRVACSYEPPNT